MTRVADILAAKGTTVHAISPDASVYEAIERMVQHLQRHTQRRVNRLDLVGDLARVAARPIGSNNKREHARENAQRPLPDQAWKPRACAAVQGD